MGNERRTLAGRGLDRTLHGFAVSDKLIQFRCATRDLGDRPITNGRTEHRAVHLLEEVTESRIGWRTPQLNPQCAGESDVVADGVGEAFSVRNSVRDHEGSCCRCRPWPSAKQSMPRTATRRKYQAGMRIPRRIRMSGMARKKLIRSRSIAAEWDSDKGTQQSRPGHRKRSPLARPRLGQTLNQP
jgi:hypothetical protein